MLMMVVLPFSPLVASMANAAGVPSILGYQGRLADSSGNLLGGSGSTYYFKFSLWSSPTVGSGNRLWPASAPSSFSSTVRQGVFTVNIGDTANGYPDALNYTFNASTLYLQVEVSSDNVTFETLSPRQQISSAAFAQVAGGVSGLTQSSIGTTTPAGNAVLTVEATSSSAIPLLLRGVTGQSVNLFQMNDGSGASVFSVGNSGLATLTNLLLNGSTTLQNFSFVNAAGTNATTTNLFSTTASSTNLFSQAAALGTLTLGTALGIANGGTNNSSGGTTGGLFYFDGTKHTNSSLLTYTAAAGSALIGTTTAPQTVLSLGTSTAPQLALSDNTAGDNLWTMRSIGNFFYIATSTATATSSTSSFYIDTNGFVYSPLAKASSGNNCLQIDATGKITNTGSACSSGGGSSWPFTTGLSNFGTSTQATTTNEWFQMGLQASSTSQLATANIWNVLNLKATSSALLATDASGNVIATSSIGTNLLTGTLATINTTPITPGGTFTITAASSTLLANNNTWTGLNTFSNSSTTLVTISGSTWFTNGSLNSALLSTDQNGKLVATTSVGVNYLSGVLPIGNGGTNATSFTTGAPIAFDGTRLVSSTTLAIAYGGTGTSTPATYGNILTWNGGNWQGTATSTLAIALSDTKGTLAINRGGANATSYTQGTLLAYDGTSFVSTTTIGNNQLQNSAISGITLGNNLASLSHDTTLNGSSYNGSSAISNWGLNLANSNWWTAAQNFTNASTSQFTATSSVWFTGVTASSLLALDSNQKLVATSTIGNSLLTNNGALTINTSGPLSGGGSVALGGTLNLACATCSTWPFTTGLTNFGTSTQATTTAEWFQMGLMASSTSQFVSATTTNLGFTGISNTLLSANASGQVIASTTIGWNLLKGPASSIFAFDGSGNPIATTSIGVNYLTGVLPIANGGTNNNSGGTTNGINYFDGSKYANSSLLTYLAAAGSALIGTTTAPQSILTLGTSTVPQLSLSDNTAGSYAWTFRNTGSTLYIATSTATATSSTPFLTFEKTDSADSANVGTLHLHGSFNVDGNYGFTNIGSTLFIDHSAGNIFVPGGGIGFTTNSVAGRFSTINAYISDANTGALQIGTTNNNASGRLTIGTSTAYYSLTVASSTGPQIYLSDGTVANNGWTMRSSGNFFYLATSTYRATSTTAVFSLDSNGLPYFPSLGTSGAISVGAGGVLSAGTLSIANGGTNASTQTTNGITYFDGTKLTTGSTFIFNGTNVGIGTTTPMSILALNSGQIAAPAASAGAPSYAFGNSLSTGMWAPAANALAWSTAGIEGMRMNSSQQVGINAAAGFATSLSGITPILQVNEGGGVAQTIIRSSNDVFGSNLVFQKTRGTNGTVLTTVANGDSLGQIGWGGADGTNWQFTSQIRALVNGTVAAGSIPTDLLFYTGTGSQGTERLRITSAGNVGIGTTSPQSLLALHGSAPVFTLGDTQASSREFQLRNGSIAAGKFDIYDLGNAASRLTIDGSGNIGIGTTTPFTKLEVNDEIISGAYKGAGGNIRMIGGSYGSLFRNDGSSTYLLLTNSGDQYGVWNSLRPFYVSDATGAVTMNNGVTMGGGSLTLNNGTSNTIFYGSTGVAAPGASSAGEKIQLYGVAGTVGSADYALGIENNNMWFNSGGAYKWYENSSQKMTLDLSGNVGIGTTSPAANFAVAGNGYFTGGLGIGTNLPTTGLYVANPLSSGTLTTQGIAIGMESGTFAAQEMFGTSGDNIDWSAASGHDYDFRQIYTASTNDFQIYSSSTLSILDIKANGNVGIGTTTPNDTLTVAASAAPQIALTDGTAGSNEWTFRNAGGILYIATSTYAATSSVSAFKLDGNGNLTIIGSATTCTIGNGTSATNCSSSDQRLKDNIQTLAATSGLAAINALNPVSFYWNQWMQSTGNSTSTQFGFVAQQVQQVFPNLVEQDPNTHYYKLDYQGLIAPIIKAIQEIATISGAFKANLIAWMGDATNGIGKFFANEVHAKKLCVDDDAGGSTCVTKPQLDALLAGAGTASGASGGGTGGNTSSGGVTSSATSSGGVASGTSSPPVISINGNNPAHLTVGNLYVDLGASITGPTNADKNLGLRTFVDGKAMDVPLINTSAAGTHTVDYVATNAAGTATSTRTVIVDALAPVAPPPGTTASSTTPAATSTATTTP